MRLRLLAVLAVLALAGAGLYLLRRPAPDTGPAPAASTARDAQTAAVAAPGAAPAPGAPQEALPAAIPEVTEAELAGTARMYLAHAPLREPEFADPDSEANRKVMETMVLKAIGSSERFPAPANETTLSH